GFYMPLSKQEIIKYYDDNRNKYEKFSDRLREKLINELGNIDGLKVTPIVQSRVKKRETFILKSLKKGYKNLAKEFTDFAALRIVTQDLEEVEKVCNYIKNSYKIDWKNSADKKDLLATDQVGYLSVHFIVSLDRDALKAGENKPYKGLKAEIQVRTLLQHAWAELTHDKIYKSTENTDDKDLIRRVNLMAGLLELADIQFVSINEEIRKTQENLVDESINVTSLNLFMRENFKESLFLDIQQIIKELYENGIDTITKLKGLLNKELLTRLHEIEEVRVYDGIIRNILIITDAEKYFSSKGSKKEISTTSMYLYNQCNLPIESLIEKYNVKIKQ
ncbi:MAG: hypothetical protein K2M17_02745, partial [Bacilli bacterium]|nr:hypothetical protein [Bacilli bacterium]